jgi:chromosomal replication initiation ATPase DnaA
MTQPQSPQQLSFDLPSKPALGRDDFFVSPGNAVAVATIESATPWPGGKLVLCGPAGSGKTHLSHVWAELSGARVVQAHDLAEADIPALADGPVAVENVPGIAADIPAQNALFHLHNLALAQGNAVLLTGRAAPSLWALSLADLQSRVMAAHVVTLAPPDDALLAAVLAKLFNDRQVIPKPDVIPYLVAQIERSFEAAAAIVEALDRAALTQGRTVSRPLAAHLIAEARENG